MHRPSGCTYFTCVFFSIDAFKIGYKYIQICNIHFFFFFFQSLNGIVIVLSEVAVLKENRPNKSLLAG